LLKVQKADIQRSVQYGAHYTISKNFAGYTACSSFTKQTCMMNYT